MGEDAPKNSRVAEATDLGRYAGLGFQFAATMLLFGAAGWWLDTKLGTSPWLLIAGIFLGATGAFIALLRAVGGAKAGGAKKRPPQTGGHESDAEGPR